MSNAKKPGLTPKRELFCREYLVDLNQTKAAARAGFKQSHVQGAQLMAISEVQAYIAELQTTVAERNDITIDGVCKELAGIRDDARKAGQYSAATQAEMGIAKTAGLLIERRIDETERSKSDADLAKDIAAVASVQHRGEIETIVVELLRGNPSPLEGLLQRVERLQPRAVA